MENYMLPCMNKYFFGIDCPGCGLQRAIALLFQGDFIGAFELFPAVYPMIFFFMVIGLHFIDSKRNYQMAIRVLSILTASIMLLHYFIKITNKIN